MSQNAQNTNQLLMIKPKQFYAFEETASKNSFQQIIDLNNDPIQFLFNNCVELLNQNEIEVVVIESEVVDSPDVLVPNNWVTINHDGTAVNYPMLTKNRKRERMVNIKSQRNSRFIINDEVDFSNHELNGCYLEGAGSRNIFTFKRSYDTSTK